MKRFAAIQGCVAVLLAFLLAPFVHLHASRGYDRNGIPSDEAAVVHSHTSLHVDEAAPDGETVVRSRHSGQAQQLSIFDFRQANSGPQPALISLGVSVALELRVCQHVSDAPSAVAHAPPVVHCSGLRSPPA